MDQPVPVSWAPYVHSHILTTLSFHCETAIGLFVWLEESYKNMQMNVELCVLQLP